MAKQIDGVIEAARYAPDGSIVMVRVYERRGATFSDYVLLDRKTLVEKLKKGKKFVTGQRTAFGTRGSSVRIRPPRLKNLAGLPRLKNLAGLPRLENR